MSLLWAFVATFESEGEYTLDADESRHVTARRLRVGDSLVLFNGAGRTGSARIEEMSKRAVRVVVDAVEEEPLVASGCVLATAIPKGDRLSTMLQMMTQLGVATWQPLILDDSSVRSLDAESKRLHRIRVESAKVARRPRLLSIAQPSSLDAALDTHGDSEGAGGSIYFGDREGAATGFDGMPALVLIGPEAGFSEAERRRILERGASPCAFSPHNLRIEVAAISAAVALNLASGTVPGEAGGEGGQHGDR